MIKFPLFGLDHQTSHLAPERLGEYCPVPSAWGVPDLVLDRWPAYATFDRLWFLRFFVKFVHASQRPGVLELFVFAVCCLSFCVPYAPFFYDIALLYHYGWLSSNISVRFDKTSLIYYNDNQQNIFMKEKRADVVASTLISNEPRSDSVYSGYRPRTNNLTMDIINQSQYKIKQLYYYCVKPGALFAGLSAVSTKSSPCVLAGRSSLFPLFLLAGLYLGRPAVPLGGE